MGWKERLVATFYVAVERGGRCLGLGHGLGTEVGYLT